MDLKCTSVQQARRERNFELFNGNLEDAYEIVRKIGEGATAEVCLATHKNTGIGRAIKIIPKFYGSKPEIESIMTEIEILERISHPNIMPLVECFDSPVSISLVTDMYRGGDLFGEIYRRKTFSEEAAALVVRQLLSCVAYLAENNIVHRDIKPENIMLENPHDLSSIKLIDFGHATTYNPRSDGLLKETLGSPYYVAPEVLYGKYNNKCDIWSIGVIAFLLLCGYPPFNGSSNESIFRKIYKGEFSMETDSWSDVSSKGKDFIRLLLTFDYSLRPEAKEALGLDIMQPPKLVRTSKAVQLDIRCNQDIMNRNSRCIINI